MLEEKRYICEICGTAYRSSYSCIECEESHCNHVSIVAKRHYRAENKYPSIIYIEMDDGETIKYERMGGTNE